MNKIQFLRNSVAGIAPQPADMLEGGIAINMADGKLFTKNAAGVVIDLGVSVSDLSAVAFSGNYNDLLNRPNISGSLQFVGPWNASTNTPTIPTAGPSNASTYYVVSVAGTTMIDGNNVWAVGDLIVSNGIVWTRIPLSQPIDLTANISFMATGTPAVLDPIRYIFTRSCSFGNAFLGSQAFATLSNATDTVVNMQKIAGGVTTTVGTLTFTGATGTGVFTSNATTTTFSPGDNLLFTPADTNISNMSVNVQGVYATA